MPQLQRSIRVATFGILIVLSGAPAFAQVDLNGGWASRVYEDWIERLPGPDLVDYLGLPLNDAGRSEALMYTPSELQMSERQCLYYSPAYLVLGPQGMRIWSETDPVLGNVVAWKIGAAIDRDIITIWMDGRPHPSDNAFHPFSGFTTGAWEGDTLTAYTTHVKMSYERRNGVPSSDRTTIEWRFFRHDDLLTIMAMVNDPVYLEEPHVLTRTWELHPRSNASPTPNPCVPVTEVDRLDAFGEVPHNLPDKNPDLNEFSKRYNIPLEAALGGPETLYPEYRKKLTGYTPPDRCVRYCCGWLSYEDPDGGGAARGLTCMSGGGGQPRVHAPTVAPILPLEPARRRRNP